MGNERVVQFLLSCDGIDVNKIDYDNSTPLFNAASNGHVDVCKVLLSHKDIDYNKKGPNNVIFLLYWKLIIINQNLLHVVTRYENVDIVKILVSKGKDLKVNIKGILGYTALHWAAHIGNLKIVELLASVEDIDLNALDKAHCTPLHRAVEHGKADVVEFLISLDAVDINIKTDKGMTAYQIACKFRFDKIKNDLLTRKDIEI